MAGGERTPVAIAVDGEDHGVVGSAGPEEVAVQRVREAVVGNGEAGGPQRLRCHLAAVEADARVTVVPVATAEQVAVELLEVEERGEVGDVAVVQLGLGHGPEPATLASS